MLKTPQKPKVLHVYGNTTAAKTLTAILRLYGYDAAHVYTAAEALVWCGMNWPDVVIADLTTEPRDGIQLAVQVASGQPKCKVLLLGDPVTAGTLLRDSTMADYPFPILDQPVDPQKVLDFLASV